MAEDGLGTMILSSKDINSPLKMPEIPIRANNSIPKTIGVLMFLGGLLVFLIGSLFFIQQFSEYKNTEEEARAYKLLGIDITAEELELLNKEYKARNHFSISGSFQILSGLLLIIGGIQLFLCKRIGIKTSMIAGTIWFLVNISTSSWSSSIDSELGISLESQWDTVELALCFICNMFCILLPLIPMLVPAGSAALSPPKHISKNFFSEE